MRMAGREGGGGGRVGIGDGERLNKRTTQRFPHAVIQNIVG